jgi:DNA-binding response OmpR family regulator
MKILLLEDEIEYNETIREYLESLGYEVVSFEHGDRALEAIYEEPFHLLLLDIRVPGASGYDIVRQLRAEGNDLPVIFITSLTDIDDLSIGYELGCNDYIRKPFASQELKYRLEQVLKLYYYHSNKESVALEEGYRFEIGSGNILHDDTVVPLSEKERKVVEYLVTHAGEYVPTRRLWEEVWEYKMVTEADIRMCIRKIRTKTHSGLIVSQKGLGYKIDRI